MEKLLERIRNRKEKDDKPQEEENIISQSILEKFKDDYYTIKSTQPNNNNITDKYKNMICKNCNVTGHNAIRCISNTCLLCKKCEESEFRNFIFELFSVKNPKTVDEMTKLINPSTLTGFKNSCNFARNLIMFDYNEGNTDITAHNKFISITNHFIDKIHLLLFNIDTWKLAATFESELNNILYSNNMSTKYSGPKKFLFDTGYDKHLLINKTINKDIFEDILIYTAKFNNVNYSTNVKEDKIIFEDRNKEISIIKEELDLNENAENYPESIKELKNLIGTKRSNESDEDIEINNNKLTFDVVLEVLKKSKSLKDFYKSEIWKMKNSYKFKDAFNLHQHLYDLDNY